jgi:hypothetical protein
VAGGAVAAAVVGSSCGGASASSLFADGVACGVVAGALWSPGSFTCTESVGFVGVGRATCRGFRLLFYAASTFFTVCGSLWRDPVQPDYCPCSICVLCCFSSSSTMLVVFCSGAFVRRHVSVAFRSSLFFLAEVISYCCNGVVLTLSVLCKAFSWPRISLAPFSAWAEAVVVSVHGLSACFLNLYIYQTGRSVT